jgi:hypothetical protein
LLANEDLFVKEVRPYLVNELGGELTLVIDMVTKFDWIAVINGGKSENVKLCSFTGSSGYVAK